MEAKLKWEWRVNLFFKLLNTREADFEPLKPIPFHLNSKINRMSKSPIENTTGPLLHIVFFWLKEPENQEHRAQFETAIKKLIATNPQAIANHLGGPAASEKRAVVDNSFTYCYTMSFPSLEAQNAYQTDPTHELFIEEASPLWERVLVSDSLSLS